MLINLKKDKIAMYEKEGKKWNESDYVFLNTIGVPGGIRRAASGKESTRLFSYPPFRIPLNILFSKKNNNSF